MSECNGRDNIAEDGLLLMKLLVHPRHTMQRINDTYNASSPLLMQGKGLTW